jgi:hypothetical protein
LLIREAIEEDHDQLSQISDKDTLISTKIFGEFYLAEIISSKSWDKICLVAETEDKKIVGMMIATTDINYDFILTNYDV